MQRCESCRTSRATSFRNHFHPAGGSESAEGSVEAEPVSGGSGMAAACERASVNADVGSCAGAMRDRQCRGRAWRPLMSGLITAALSAAALKGICSVGDDAEPAVPAPDLAQLGLLLVALEVLCPAFALLAAEADVQGAAAEPFAPEPQARSPPPRPPPLLPPLRLPPSGYSVCADTPQPAGTRFDAISPTPPSQRVHPYHLCYLRVRGNDLRDLGLHPTASGYSVWYLTVQDDAIKRHGDREAPSRQRTSNTPSQP
eukprot:400215-Rhodomonas_salina.1